MGYIDGYVLEVPTTKREEYLVQANLAAAIFKEFSALRVVACGVMMYRGASSLHSLWWRNAKVMKWWFSRGLNGLQNKRNTAFADYLKMPYFRASSRH